MLLAPFQQFALEVHFLIGHFVDVDEAMQYLICYKAFTNGIAPVQIDGTDECFKCVSSKVAVVRLVMFVSPNQFVEPNLSCQLSKRLALHDFATRIGQEALALARKMVIDDLANDSPQHSIAQEFEPLVVELRPAFPVSMHRLVHQSFLIETNVVGIESQHIIKSATKLLLLPERKLYRVYQVNGRHRSYSAYFLKITQAL